VTAVSVMPPWEGFLVPVLQVLSDGQQRARRELMTLVPARIGMPEEQRAEVLGSGQAKSENRIGWALSGLTRAQALDRPTRGHHVITDVGRALLAKHPTELNEGHLKEIPAYIEYTPRPSHSPTGVVVDPSDVNLDPIEQIEQGVERLNADVATELLTRLREQNPQFLEQSVLDVLVAMGYGGTEQRARRIGGTGDGGVDGVIDQDPLGLERIYVQAKRYAADSPIGPEVVQSFVGALHGKNATRGVFITTSRFTQGAQEYAGGISSRVILIDGPRLADLMIKYGIGVQTKQAYTVVEVDEDYFE
jgi:restriction system protein